MNPSASQTPVTGWRELQQALRSAGHRRLVVLEGDRAASLKWLALCLPQLSVEPGLWVGHASDRPDNRLTAQKPNQARRWLGRELNCVVWDGWQGNQPDGLAALSGTLSAGGLLFWLMPPLTDWVLFDDPDYQRVGLDSASSHPFAGRLANVIAGDPSVIRVNPSVQSGETPPEPLSTGAPFRVAATAEQSALVADIVRMGLGRRRRPLVITADRGRGKSAALGMAARRLLDEGRQRVIVTAPGQEAVNTLFRHASATEKQAAVNGQLVFFPVEHLLAERPSAELVIVDEAAAIPPDRLKQILLGWPRVVFATTVHGYEGAGRGFSVRFREVLDQHTPQWKSTTLKAPIRWSASDPLEPLTSRMYLLNAESPRCDEATSGEVVIERWYPASASDSELGDAFGLLVEAHYRTSPADLRQWMDDPGAASWRAIKNGVVVGVLWASREGGLEAGLAREVMLGQRRIRGHLLPQSLATHSGFSEAAEQIIMRVVRIAVSPGVRHRGVGTALVQAARDDAQKNDVDAIGASFGGQLELLSFWQHAGLVPVRLGLTREASSGELPLQVLCGVSERGRELVAQLRQRLAEHWLMLIPTVWSGVDPRFLLQLTQSLPETEPLNANDRRDLHSFAYGHRGFDLTQPVLRKLSLQQNVTSWLCTGAHENLPALWSRVVLQGWPWAAVQSLGLCKGRDEGERLLRAAVGKLLQNRDLEVLLIQAGGEI